MHLPISLATTSISFCVEWYTGLKALLYSKCSLLLSIILNKPIIGWVLVLKSFSNKYGLTSSYSIPVRNITMPVEYWFKSTITLQLWSFAI